MIRHIRARLPCLGLALLAAASPAAAATIMKGPFPQNVQRDRITVVVELDEPAALTLKYGTSESLGQTLESPAALRHEIIVSGLVPSTPFFYAIEGAMPRANPYAPGGVNQLGGRTVTAPGPSAKFSFLIYGDSRSRPSAHHNVASAAAKEPVDFGINTGDLISSGQVLEQWQEYFDIEHELLRNIPMFDTAGNHEEHDGHADNFENFFALPSNSGNELYYSFRYGNAFFLILDANVHITYFGDFDLEQRTFIQKELAAAYADPDIQHRFAVVHQGPYSSNPDRSGNTYVRALHDLFKIYGVTAIISGHDHFYERGTTGNGIPYIVIGAGGAPLYETIGPGKVDNPSYPHDVAAAIATDSYGVAEIDGPHFRLVAKRPDGTVVDDFSYEAAPVPHGECASAPDCESRSQPPGGCRGAYECVASQCILQCGWTPCVRERDCKEVIEAACGGYGSALCIFGECQTVCEDPPAGAKECGKATDCEDRTPPENCDGDWKCQKGLCEYACPVETGDPEGAAEGPEGTLPETEGPEGHSAPPDRDPGPVDPSAPETPSGPAGTSGPTSTDTADDADAPAPSDADAGSEAAATGSGDSGCACGLTAPGRAAPAQALPFLLALMLLVAARRRP